jgi:hypothetical protein
LFLGGIHRPTLIALNIYIINIPIGIAKNNKRNIGTDLSIGNMA